MACYKIVEKTQLYKVEHGVAQSTFSAMSGMDATIGGFKQFANTWGGSMATGFVMGGIGAGITGGDIWQGAAVGCVVALANFSLHKVVDDWQYKSNLKQDFKDGHIDKNDIATEGDIGTIRDLPTNKALSNLADNPSITYEEVIYSNDGKGTKECYGQTRATVNEDVTAYNKPTIAVSQMAMGSKWTLAITIGHEMNHAIDYVSGSYYNNVQSKDKNYADKISEDNAMAWEKSMNQ